MSSNFWGVEWLNANETRAYPFAAGTTRTDQSGDFTIPDDFLVSLYIPIHAGLRVQPDQFFIRSLVLFGIGYSLSVAYNDGSGDPPIVATAVVARSTHTEFMSYVLAGAGDFDDVVGKIAVGRLGSIDALPPGQYTFDFAAAALDQDCIRPMLRGVSSITVVNQGESSGRLYGDFELAAGTNYRISPILVEGQPARIRFDAIDGEGLTEDCVCVDSDQQSPPIRKINGISPTPGGDFTIAAVDCLTIAGIANGLLLADRCASPCCSQPQLDTITADMIVLGNYVRTLQNTLANLVSEQNQFRASVLASVVGDNGCTSC